MAAGDRRSDGGADVAANDMVVVTLRVMAEPALRQNAVVRPLSRVAARRCARPGCPSPAQATLAFRYDSREAFLGPLVEQAGPELYDLCSDHAGKTRPPYGWTLVDERPDESPEGSPTPDVLGSEQTVAVLAAALRREPDEPSAPGADVVAGVDADLLASPDEDDDALVAPPTADDEFTSAALEELAALADDGRGEDDGVEARTVPAAREREA